MWVQHLPHDSAIARSQDGEAAIWGLHGQLLAAIADLLNLANWQRAGCKGVAPTPIRRPGVEAEGVVHGGDTGLDNEAVMEILHGYRTGAYAQQGDIDEG